MGGSESKADGRARGHAGSSDKAAASSSKASRTALPPEPPYPGPPTQYNFINTDVKIKSETTFSLTRTAEVTSNVDSYYPALADQYAQGYRLLSFYKIPHSERQSGYMSVTSDFQGIFCRYPTAAPRRESWWLRVEKSAIQLRYVSKGIITVQGGAVSDTSHVLDSIARNTQAGGRLVCLELTGEEQSSSAHLARKGFTPLLGVDLFFEVPDSQGAQQYVYNCASVPIEITYKMGFKNVPRAHCDWLGVLSTHLNQGWRLIEIFYDKAEHTRAGPFTSAEEHINSMWFFEKPASRLNDPRPVYEGIVIDHQIKTKQAFGGYKTTTKWEPVIQEMGNRGWELACILETPEFRSSGLITLYFTCKLFFQRPILPLVQAADAGAGAGASAAVPSDLPPPYDLVVGGMWGGEGEGGAVGSLSASSAPPPPFSSSFHSP